MAKIIEANSVLTISKIIKNTDEDATIEFPEGFVETMTELVTQLLGEGYVIEFTDIQ